MLECREITKLYGRKAAVDNVSFKLEPGKIYAMLGPNGSGKTTLMNILFGIYQADENGGRAGKAEQRGLLLQWRAGRSEEPSGGRLHVD